MTNKRCPLAEIKKPSLVRKLQMRLLVLALALIVTRISYGQAFQQKFVTDDITNFWQAYQKITSTKDGAQQYKFLHNYYLDKGTEGLQALIKVRNYTDKELLAVITRAGYTNKDK